MFETLSETLFILASILLVCLILGAALNPAGLDAFINHSLPQITH